MDISKSPGQIDHDRRRFVGTAAAGLAAAYGLLPSQAVAAVESNEIHPFHVNVPEEALVDLRRRVKSTRLPDKEQVTDQSQGVQLATIQQLAHYWQTGYDWRKIEARLTPCRNSLPRSTGWTFISFTFVRSIKMRYRWS